MAVALGSNLPWLSGGSIFLDHAALSQASGGLQEESSLLLGTAWVEKQASVSSVCQGLGAGLRGALEPSLAA